MRYWVESGGRNILQAIKRRKANWIGHILHWNCLLKHVIEGKTEGRIEVTRGRGRRCKQLLYDLNETDRYWKLKDVGCQQCVWYLTCVLCLPNCKRLCMCNCWFFYLFSDIVYTFGHFCCWGCTLNLPTGQGIEFPPLCPSRAAGCQKNCICVRVTPGQFLLTVPWTPLFNPCIRAHRATSSRRPE